MLSTMMVQESNAETVFEVTEYIIILSKTLIALFDSALIFHGNASCSVGSKSLNLRKKAGIKFSDLFLYLNVLKEPLATFL